MKSMARSSRHLVIIWPSGVQFEQEIVSELVKYFVLLNTGTINWLDQNFDNNLKRFYGGKQLSVARKLQECGRGSIRYLILDDQSPEFCYVSTTSGVQWVNKKIFDVKIDLREILPVKNVIHMTNNAWELSRDQHLLFGKHSSNRESKISRLVGEDGWNSLAEMFDTLNIAIDYVILRNYSHLHQNITSKNHGDLDFLVSDKDLAVDILNAKPNWADRHQNRVHYTVQIEGEKVPIDLRYVGDGYYPMKWQQQILRNRELHDSGFYVPCEEDYKYSLLYHALVHKKIISQDYLEEFASLFPGRIDSPGYLETELEDFVIREGLGFSLPVDGGVHFSGRFLKFLSPNERLNVQTRSPFRPRTAIERFRDLLYSLKRKLLGTKK